MNKSFKVVFNKARGALMVVNEVTSSVQAKGTKTVIAAAVASLVAGAAMATTAETPKTTVAWDTVKANTTFDGYVSVTEGDNKNGAVLADTGASGTRVGLVFTNNKSAGKAGALAVEAGANIVLKDAQFTGNEAAGFGGAIRVWGKDGTNKGQLTLETSKDVVYAGNKAGTQTEVQSGGATGLGGRYADMGGFAHLQGYSDLTLKAAEGTTLTIGQEGADKTAGLDSISSSNGNNTLVVDGKGTVKVNGSMESFRDAINVSNGTLVMATGFGSVDIGVQGQANANAYAGAEDSGATVAQTATMTVNSGATVEMGALVVNAATTNAAGTKVVVNDGGKVTVDSIHVTTAVYKDKVVANSADKLASGSLTTTGHGEFSVAASGAATVTKDLTVDAATKFDKKGDGLLTVQGTLSTAAAVAEASGQTAKAAGEFNLAAGSVTTNGYVNAGKTTLGNGTTLKVTGTAENTGVIEGTSGNLTVAEGAVFKNAASGSMTGLDTLTVEKGATLTNEHNIATDKLVVNGLVNTLVKDKAGNLQFNTVTLNEGGAFNMTNAILSGGLVFVDGTVNFKGGDFQVGGKVFQGDMTVGGAANTVAVNFEKGDYTFGKIATAGTAAKALKVNGAQLTVTELALNAGASAMVSAGALTVDTLKLANSGAATVNGGTLTIKTALDNTTSAGALTVEKAGTLATSTAALGGLKVDASGAVSFASGSKFASGSIANTGTIVLSGLEGGEYTAETLKNVRSNVQTGAGLLDLGKVTVKDALTSGGDLKWTDITGSGNLAGIGTEQFAGLTVTGVSGNTTANGSYGAFELASKDATAGVGANTTLTLNGTGALVQFVPESGAATVKGLTLQSGAALVTTGKDALIGKVAKDAGASGTALNIASGSLKVEEEVGASGALIDVDTLTIGEGAGLSVGLVKAAVAPSGNTSGSAAVYGDINVGTLKVEGTLDASVNKVTVGSGFVTGVATVKELSATQTVSVGTADATGLLVVEKFTSGTIFADPSWESGKPAAKVAVKELASGASVHAGRNSIVALGTTDYAAGVKAVADAGFVLADATAEGAADNAVNSALYVTGTKSTDETTGEAQYTAFDGKVLVDNASGAGTLDKVQVAKGSLMVLDVAAFDTTGATAVFNQAVDFAQGSTLYLANVVNGNKIQLSANGSGLNVVEQNEDLLFTGDMLMEAKVSQTGGTLEIAMIDKAEVADEFGNVPGLDLGYEYFKTGANLGNNSKSAQFANWLWSSQNHDSYAAIRTAAKDVASLGATTGVQTVTMDAVNMMADTAAARTTMLNHKAEGAQVWADVNGGAFEAESLFGGAGYKSDMWAGTIGVDYTAACGGTLGVALTVGTADTDSTNTGVKSSADSDLLGFTVYASQTFNDVFGLAADIGYLKASNEVKANGYEHSWKFDQDTDAFTFGLRGEVLTKVGGVNIVPHAGLRYTRLSTDGFEAGYKTEFANQNVFQLPLGVTVAAEFESADWTFAPKFDLSVVPTFGDKDAEMTLGIAGVKASEDLAVRVLDSNPVQATLGVSATTGAWNFGINYKLGAGSDDRMNNTFNANVRYAF